MDKIEIKITFSDKDVFVGHYTRYDEDSFLAMIEDYIKFFEKFQSSGRYSESDWSYPAVFEDGQMAYKILPDGAWDELLSVVA